MTSILLLLAACAPNLGSADPADSIGDYSDTADDAVEVIPSVDDGEPSVVCDLDENDPYDWNQVITYDLTISDEDIEYLANLGYTWGETYEQLPPVTGTVDITPDGCETTTFTDVQMEIGREMGYIAPPGETSWRVDFNEVNDDQKLGGYDNARWWSPIYSGPVAEMFLYRFATTYVGIPGRRMAWMELGTSYWPSDFYATYNAFEPNKEDMMDRDYGQDGWVSVFEGDPSWNTCQTGSCDTERLNACLDTLANVSDSDALLEETSDCFDWENIAAVYAWEVYFSHWDGCVSPHNCYVEELGDPASPDTTTFSYRISGVDLVNPNWVTVSDVSFYTWNTLLYPCWQDQSEGGCRDMMVEDVRSLIAIGREGLMNADLDTVALQRQSLNLWWEGEDEEWYADQAEWLAARPDYVETALETALDPCNDWASNGWYYWDTGGSSGCTWDTGSYDTGGSRDTGSPMDTGSTPVDTAETDSDTSEVIDTSTPPDTGL